MSEIRGEKVKFGKGDIVSLHELPSAQAHEPIVLHCTDRPSHASVLLKLFGGIGVLMALLIVLVVTLIESGLVDAPLNARAMTALNKTLGPNYSASVDRTVLRFSSFGGLALKAENVVLADKASGQNVANVAAVSIALDPLALLSGRVSASSLDIQKAMFNPALLPRGAAFDFTAVRLADIPSYQSSAFDHLDKIKAMIEGNGLSRVRITELSLPLVGPDGGLHALEVAHLTFARSKVGSMFIAGEYALGEQTGEIDLITQGTTEIHEVQGNLSGIPLNWIATRATVEGNPKFGIKAQADLSLSATRASVDRKPSLVLTVATQGGSVYLDGVGASLKATKLSAFYDYDQRSVEFGQSVIRVGASSFPFTGGLIDLEQISDSNDKGFAIDLLVHDAVSAPEDTNEPPVRFDAKAGGRLLFDRKQILFDQLGVSTANESMAGSLGITFGGTSPQINFAMVSDRLQATVVKQLWPYWLGKKARQWVIGNIYGGTVTNGRIEVSMAADRPKRADGRLLLGQGELTIAFDVDDTRVNIGGAIPPLRDAAGHFELHGEKIDVSIKSGAAFMPSGRFVNVTGGTFRLPDSYARPLMAELDINISGASDAVAELVTYKPIDVLKRTEFVPEDFSGPISGNVKARFGLVRDQKPPPPQWTADINLQGVDVKKPIVGREISQVDGKLTINTTRADLKANARIDGVPLEVVLREPVDKSAGLERELSISGKIGEKDRARLFPGLNDILAGPVGIAVETQPDGRQKVSADLGQTVVSFPWVGWSKGAGVPAKATFVLDKEDAATRISDFNFSGDGFAVEGSIALNGAALNSARFSDVRLSAQDRYAVSINRSKAGYVVKVQGEVADIRPVLARIKGNPTSAGGAQDSVPVTLRADVGRVYGFNGEALRNVTLDYAASGGRLTGLDLRGVSGSGQAVVARLTKGGSSVLELTSSDAGAVARFANIYRHMDGGLLNMRLKAGADGSWRGAIDVRKFKLTGEEKLRSMVTTQAGGKSLNEAVRKDIDTSSMRFERGFAFVTARQGTLQVENGVVRGESVGATFQGMVRDANNRMELTGTFMPAYGLNRLFAELPLVGFILGNGSDRGLIGITFKLTGPFDRPALFVNPLSVIAPGVFRNIFEF